MRTSEQKVQNEASADESEAKTALADASKERVLRARRLRLPSNVRLQILRRSTRCLHLMIKIEADDLRKRFLKPDAGQMDWNKFLSASLADTSRTVPSEADRHAFMQANHKAEARRAEMDCDLTSNPPETIQSVHFGSFEMNAWYVSPYPEEYSRNRVLYICEFCLKYMNSEYVSWRHHLKCPMKCPPGDEIYRDGSLSVFEVDGRKSPIYCQNLCLLAKMFLRSKTLYYDIEPFLFYIMTEYDDIGCHLIGYFSKEKRSNSDYNVSCILTLPIYQRKGYGNFLIEFSYLLSQREGKVGTPEKPLSYLGLLSYRNYWKIKMCYELCSLTKPTSIQEISKRTSMTPDDVISALERLDALVHDPVSKIFAIRVDQNKLQDICDKWAKKGYQSVKPSCLKWVPFLQGKISDLKESINMSSISKYNESYFSKEKDAVVNVSGNVLNEAVTNEMKYSTSFHQTVSVCNPEQSSENYLSANSKAMLGCELDLLIPASRFQSVTSILYHKGASKRGRPLGKVHGRKTCVSTNYSTSKEPLSSCSDKSQDFSCNELGLINNGDSHMSN